MSIDIPRVQPIVTPRGAMDDDELRVRRAAREPRIPAELPHPSQDRRAVPERRRSAQKRKSFELRDGQERRAHVDTSV